MKPAAAQSTPGPSRQPSILDVAQGPDQLTDTYLVSAIGRAAASDWRASAWILEHDPRFRPIYSDGGYERKVERKLCAVVIRAIEAAPLPPDQRRLVFLHLAGTGLGVIEPGGSLDD